MQKTENEITNLEYLEKYNFSKRLAKLQKKLHGKRIVVYGVGQFFKTIYENYDLSGLNIIGVSDNRFVNHEPDEEFLGYKVYAPQEIIDTKPEYVIVATKFYMNIIEDFYYNKFKGKNIKIIPLVKKDFWTLLKEVFKEG